MAIYNFSDLIGSSTAFTGVDVLFFGSNTDASELVIAQSGLNVTVKQGTSIATLKNFKLEQIGKTTFVFDNGSVAFIGDGVTATTGDAGNNLLVGTELNDYLNGLGGIADTVSYAASEAGVEVSLATTARQDTKGAGLDVVLNIENITGSIYSDKLTGNGVNNTIDGGLGIDTMIGNAGDDVFRVTAGDSVDGGLGIDTIESYVDFSLAAATGVENLTLLKEAGVATAIGVAGVANKLTGNASANVLDGAGGAGVDSLIGGDGNDIYIVRSGTEVITESNAIATQIDTIFSYATTGFTMAANVENARLMKGATNITGNGLNNLIYANATVNAINGGAGTDTVSYLKGSSQGVTVDLSNTSGSNVTGSGADTLSNIENVAGTNYADSLTGDSGNNVLTANRGADTLDGGVGSDTLIGGYGDDVYIVDVSTDKIVELTNQGTDLIIAKDVDVNASAVALAYIENITLQAPGLGHTLTGNSLNNILTGDTGADSLVGGSGNDTLIDGSGSGADTLDGGAGNDTFYVNVAGAVVKEAASGGTDEVISSVSYSLAAISAVGVENLTLTGTAANATGNALANKLTGNNANNVIDGGTGIDTMTGGDGADTYVVDNIADKVIETNTSTALTEADTVNSSAATYTLLANVENLTLTGTAAIKGYGNGLDNIITGNAGNNILDGKAGADNMIGGNGSDTYYVDNAGDIIDESTGSGTDSVFSTISLALSAGVENLTLTGTATSGTLNASATGNGLANTITGNAGSNVIIDDGTLADTDSDAVADILVGGSGNDTYFIHSSNDVVKEISGGGTDTINSSVTYTLNTSNAAGVENLTLLGTANNDATGNAVVNVLTGNSGNNTLDGMAGADTMIGGDGNDTYKVDNIKDIVVDANTASAGGTDTVISTVSYSLNDDTTVTSGGAGVENLTLTGTVAKNGIGNSLDNVVTGNGIANYLSGEAGNDTIDGGAGKDSLNGGDGNDTFVFSSKADTTNLAPDQILDFNVSGTDQIDLTALGFAGGTSIPAGLTFTVDVALGTTTISDAAADFAIVLIGYTTDLVAGDFV